MSASKLLSDASYDADRRISKGEERRERKNDGYGVSAETGWFKTQLCYRYADFEYGGQHQFNLKINFYLAHIQPLN